MIAHSDRSHSSISPDRCPSGVTPNRSPRLYAAIRTRFAGLSTPSNSSRHASYSSMCPMYHSRYAADSLSSNPGLSLRTAKYTFLAPIGTISTNPSGLFPNGVYRNSASTSPAFSASTAAELSRYSTYSGSSFACSKYISLSRSLPCDTGEYATFNRGQSVIFIESINSARSGVVYSA